MNEHEHWNQSEYNQSKSFVDEQRKYEKFEIFVVKNLLNFIHIVVSYIWHILWQMIIVRK